LRALRLSHGLATGGEGLVLLEAHLEGRGYLVGDQASIADVSNFAYVHVAPEAGYELDAYPAVQAWLERVQDRPGFIDDLAPYPDNARPGLSRSLYDR